ncbi:MAG: GntR family transcriptional regulator [Cupriavidus sp.]|jgi:DNA-binding GntR family transcriptional regulator|uniref:GntR family transcriptional regulator n=1 Tax=Cupriavidus pauculus TaxID=82633 RepID=UPI000781B9D7|nr:GntR family transcriptional regulator [Cupriavidus pauculus]MBU68000.1 GntR family transcriptional regulator [Cupriavidus sp.]KAB0602694.1 GntR family transcriptional regulator [Cupriavidus pauculus]MBY4734206.1 GntR family transcriptional regulator [Cupriavidus pauculus]MCM3606114.1 GntR family transcriptional regulator [Cupriavidus pauculus]UAL02861.1 GntR family transcriptional regulator [Cupriavidus pauculus]
MSTQTGRASAPTKGLPQIIRDQLRYEILKGTLPSGAQLRQDALAERFNASRIPVREALRQLETEGLVTYQRNRGAVVSGMDVTQICELLDIRVALECHAARLGVPNMVQQDFQQMQEILDAYSKSESLVEWAEYNRRFHLALCAPANNKRLRRLIEEFCLNTDRYTHEQMSLATGKDGPQADHYRILEACKARDAQQVAALLEEHILETKRNLLASERMKAED